MKKSNIIKISHSLMKQYLNQDDILIDATLGNGFDSLYCSNLVKKIYAFDIQETALKNSQELLKEKNNIALILDSHENYRAYLLAPTAAIFNLGYLPGGDKNITTKAASTLKTIKSLLNEHSLRFLLVVVYPGHHEGQKESDQLGLYFNEMTSHEVIIIKLVNRSLTSPYIFLVLK